MMLNLLTIKGKNACFSFIYFYTHTFDNHQSCAMLKESSSQKGHILGNATVNEAVLQYLPPFFSGFIVSEKRLETTSGLSHGMTSKYPIFLPHLSQNAMHVQHLAIMDRLSPLYLPPLVDTYLRIRKF